MNKWEKEIQGSLLDSEEEALEALERQYQQALNQIGEKIKLFQADIDMLDEALEAGVDDAARAVLLSQRRSKIYQKQFQEALQGQISGILDQMQGKNYATIEQYLKDCYEDGYLGSMYSLAKQGIPVITPINQAQVAQAILTDSKISTGLYSRLGVDVADLKKTISQEISRGIASSLSYADIARNINNASRSGLYNAQRIARTEGHRIQNTASRDHAEVAKAHGADLVKVWDATLDGKTRPSHRLVDGQVRELDEPFSNGLDKPGDPSGGAAEVVNCRCAEIHKPRWDVDGGFVKMDNFTGELRTFESPEDYAKFKEWYWSKENQAYMQYVNGLESKYGTKNFDKLFPQLNDREYDKLKKLEDATPLWNADAKAQILARTAAEQKPKFTFTPASTIEEAEEYISQFVNEKQFGSVGVSYKGISLEVANEVNRSLGELMQTFKVDQFGGIIAPAGNTKLGKLIQGATAAFSPVRRSFILNRSSLKDMKTAIKAFASEKEALQNLVLHPERYDWTKMSKMVKDVVARSAISGRATVPDTIAEAISHEFGHMLERSVYSSDLWAEALKNMPDYADHISGYAGFNKGEYVAESFASYWKGESKCDPTMAAIFDSLLR